MNQQIAVRARTLKSFTQRLQNVKLLLHNEGKDNLADQVHELQQDCLFDNYMDLQTAKNRLIRILK